MYQIEKMITKINVEAVRSATSVCVAAMLSVLTPDEKDLAEAAREYLINFYKEASSGVPRKE